MKIINDNFHILLMSYFFNELIINNLLYKLYKIYIYFIYNM